MYWKCEECDEINPYPDARICETCGMPITPAAEQRALMEQKIQTKRNREEREKKLLLIKLAEYIYLIKLRTIISNKIDVSERKKIAEKTSQKVRQREEYVPLPKSMDRVVFSDYISGFWIGLITGGVIDIIAAIMFPIGLVAGIIGWLIPDNFITKFSDFMIRLVAYPTAFVMYISTNRGICPFKEAAEAYWISFLGNPIVFAIFVGVIVLVFFAIRAIIFNINYNRKENKHYAEYIKEQKYLDNQEYKKNIEIEDEIKKCDKAIAIYKADLESVQKLFNTLNLNLPTQLQSSQKADFMYKIFYHINQNSLTSIEEAYQYLKNNDNRQLSNSKKAIIENELTQICNDGFNSDLAIDKKTLRHIIDLCKKYKL